MRSFALTLVAALALAGCDGAFGRSSETPAPSAKTGENCCPLTGGAASSGPAAMATGASECDSASKECSEAMECDPATECTDGPCDETMKKDCKSVCPSSKD